MVPTVGPRMLIEVENKLLWYLLWVIEGLLWVENKLLWYLLWVLEYLVRSRISYCGTYCGLKMSYCGTFCGS